MLLPKSRRRQKLREKKCQYPGCGVAFFGIHISKYCPEHRKDHYRIRTKIKPEDVNIKNQTFRHNYTEVVTMVASCSLEGCGNQFEIRVFPRQFIYPKYCPEHRNEYRRIRYLLSIGREDLIEIMKKESDTTDINSFKDKELEEDLVEIMA